MGGGRRRSGVDWSVFSCGSSDGCGGGGSASGGSFCCSTTSHRISVSASKPMSTWHAAPLHALSSSSSTTSLSVLLLLLVIDEFTLLLVALGPLVDAEGEAAPEWSVWRFPLVTRPIERASLRMSGTTFSADVRAVANVPPPRREIDASCRSAATVAAEDADEAVPRARALWRKSGTLSVVRSAMRRMSFANVVCVLTSAFVCCARMAAAPVDEDEEELAELELLVLLEEDEDDELFCMFCEEEEEED